MFIKSTSDTRDSNNNKYFCPVAQDLNNENKISMILGPKKADDEFEDDLEEDDLEEGDLEDLDDKEEVDFEEDYIDKEDDKSFYEETEFDDLDNLDEDEDEDEDEVELGGIY